MADRLARYTSYISTSSIQHNVNTLKLDTNVCTAPLPGVIALTKTVAREFSGRGITANSIAPGFIASGARVGGALLGRAGKQLRAVLCCATMPHA